MLHFTCTLHPTLHTYVAYVDTTDVQSVVAVFFRDQNRLSISCSYADNSQARGCIVMLTLSSTGEVERVEVARSSGSLCTNTDNQLEAYSNVVVVDLKASGMPGSVPLDITERVVNVSSLAQYIELTGCVEGRYDRCIK